MKNLNHLEVIRIDGARISETSFQVISANCKSLVEIGLSKCVGVTNMGIMRLVSGCINLRVLNLTCCHSITDAAISSIAYSCRSLVCLKVESCNMITEKGLCQLGSFCLLLEEIDLTDCCGVNDKGCLTFKCSHHNCSLFTFIGYNLEQFSILIYFPLCNLLITIWFPIVLICRIGILV